MRLETERDRGSRTAAGGLFRLFEPTCTQTLRALAISTSYLPQLFPSPPSPEATAYLFMGSTLTFHTNPSAHPGGTLRPQVLHDSAPRLSPPHHLTPPHKHIHTPDTPRPQVLFDSGLRPTATLSFCVEDVANEAWVEQIKASYVPLQISAGLYIGASRTPGKECPRVTLLFCWPRQPSRDVAIMLASRVTRFHKQPVGGAPCAQDGVCAVLFPPVGSLHGHHTYPTPAPHLPQLRLKPASTLPHTCSHLPHTCPTCTPLIAAFALTTSAKAAKQNQNEQQQQQRRRRRQ
eukprot:366279-Chlamydomonas_euryale.AAC.12